MSTTLCPVGKQQNAKDRPIMQKRSLIAVSLLMFVLLTVFGCASAPFMGGRLPPILSLEELARPYEKLGRIQITREVYITDLTLSANIRAWGLNALRLEAGKMNADAVILPEVTGYTSTISTMLPTTEYRATGVAIKFK